MEEKDLDLPIDKGYAWVIVAGAFCLFALESGGFKAQGIILLELTEEYEGVYPPSKLMWVFSAKFLFGSLLAPGVGLLIVKTSHRIVGAIGLILNVIGCVGLAYSRSLPAMLLTYSLIAGIGEEMMYMSSILVSSAYFEKRKALALGIIASGSGLGYALTSYILRFLFDNFSFSGACLLYGGFVLNCLIPVCLLRPMSFYTERGKNRQKMVEKTDRLVKTNKMVSEDGLDHKTQRSASFSHAERKLDIESKIFLSASQILSPTVPEIEDTVSFTDLAKAETGSSLKESSNGTTGEQLRKDKFVWKVILLPKFILLLVSLIFFILGGFIIFQFLPSLGKEAGLPKETVTIAMMIGGIAEIPFRILNGYLADLRLVTITTQYALSMLVPGFLCLICASISGLAGIALALAGMAVVGTSVFSILPVVIREMVGQQYVTSGMSIQLLFECLAFGCTTYISGALFDAFGSWRIIYFYIAAMMLLASSVVWPYCLWRWCSQRCANSTGQGTVQSANRLHGN